MRVQFWRLLLTLSLLLTLPMQGYAAARMASCDAVLAGALAVAMKTTLAGGTDGASQHAVHEMSGAEMSVAGMQDAAHGMAHVVSNDTLHSMSHELAGTGSFQHSDAPSSTHGGSHDSHGSSCMTCTPCSSGATLTCVPAVASTFLSARMLPALLVAPTSADLAHPERPPQAFLA